MNLCPSHIGLRQQSKEKWLQKSEGKIWEKKSETETKYQNVTRYSVCSVHRLQYYFRALTFSPNNNMWALISNPMSSLFLKHELKEKLCYLVVPVKSCITSQESGTVGRDLVNPNVLFYTQIPKFLPQSKCLHVTQFQSLEELVCWFCYILIICCFFINLYINLKHNSMLNEVYY